MKTNLLIKQMIAVLLAGGGLMTGGCWSSHPHSAYRAIHQYAINGDMAGEMEELAKSPGEVNLPEDDGLTPLHLAAQNCHSNVVALLLDKGAKVNVVAADKATPLHLAAQEGCTDVVEILLAKGAEINLRDNQNHTPLGRAELWHQNDVARILKQHGGTE